MVSTRLMSSVSVNNGASTSDGQGTSSSHGPPPAKFQRVGSTISNVITSSENNCETRLELLKPAFKSGPNLLDLPIEVIEKIFSYLSFKNIAHLRPVSHAMDQICGGVLNSTFQKLQNQMLIRFHNIKAKMPRRESARRNHPLACESDIIETLHMRLTLLQMSFGKHIERRHCCFFAGEVLDEVYRILHYIKKTTKLQRPYKVTDELFDLSAMAMEYFKEHIEPRLPEIAYFSSDFLDFTGGTFTSSCNSKNYLCLVSSSLGAGNSETKGDESPTHTTAEISDQSYLPSEPLPQSNMVLRKRIRKIKQGMKRYNSQLSLLRQDLRSCKRKTAEQQKQIAEQQRQLAEQQKQTLEYATRLDENDKKNEETSRKFSTLLQELNKCKTELQYWRSKSPAMPPVCKGCGAVFAPVPPEDMQALVNQGVRPEGLGLIIDENLTNNGTEECETVMDDSSLNLLTPTCSENIECSIKTTTAPEITTPMSPQTNTKSSGLKRKATAINVNLEDSNSNNSTMTISNGGGTIQSTESPLVQVNNEGKKARRISKARTKRVKNVH